MPRHAVVIGAGISGLLTARVAAETFDQVTLVDRDGLGVQLPRKGVAQARHLHVLLQKGRQLLEEFFPGLDRELQNAGAPEIDWARDTAWLSRQGWLPRVESGIVTRSCTRTLLEERVRARILSLPRLTCMENREAAELVMNQAVSRRGGARVRALRLADGEKIEADVFIDASGRTGSLLGPRKISQTINAAVGYSSCLMEIPDSAFRDFKQLYIQIRPPQSNRGGVVIPLENGLYQVTLIGAGGDHAPTNEEGFLAFAKSLASPLLSETLSDARFASPISAYRRTAGQRLLPELSEIPENLFLIGDSQCTINPIYGQGMTLAALSALTLRDFLGRDKVHSFDFHQQTRKLTRDPWMVGLSEDLRVSSATTARITPVNRAGARLASFLTDALLRKAARNPSVHRRFLRVLHLLDPPGSLLSTLLS